MSKIQDEEEEKKEKNIRIARQAIEAFNTGDISNVDKFIGTEYFNHESQADHRRAMLRGPDEFIDTVKMLRNAFVDLHYEEQEIIASNDNVVSVLTVSGKHVGNFFGIPPTGHNFSYQAVHIHRISDDDKIIEHKAIRDDLKFMLHLGLVSPASQQYEPLLQAWKHYKD